MPADIHQAADAVAVLDHDGGVVFHLDGMDQGGEVAADTDGSAEEVIHQVDAVTGDVTERASAGFFGVGDPVAESIARLEPIVGCGFGKTARPMAPSSINCLARTTLGYMRR